MQPLDWDCLLVSGSIRLPEGPRPGDLVGEPARRGELILAVPHQILRADPGWKPYTPPPLIEVRPSPLPPDPDCPF